MHVYMYVRNVSIIMNIYMSHVNYNIKEIFTNVHAFMDTGALSKKS